MIFFQERFNLGNSC